MRCGIFGGSFDPVHNGHVQVASAVGGMRGLKRVYLVPVGQPPHKPDGCEASFPERMAMLQLALREHADDGPPLEAVDLEGRRAGPSYTVDTVEQLRRSHPGVQFELFVGADMLADLPSWERAPDLVRQVRVVAFGRAGTALDQARRAFQAAFEQEVLYAGEAPLADLSSTEVRRSLAAGKPVESLLSPSVEAFIREKGLYGAGPQPPGN